MNILLIQSSSSRTQSVSREYAQKLVSRLLAANPGSTLEELDLAYANLPYLSEAMIQSFYARTERTAAEKAVIEVSDQLVAQLVRADVIVIGAPVYNFSVPAALKSYFDLVARVGLTFRYTQTGSEGLLQGRKAYVVVASGVTEAGSPIDFATGYIRHFLGFLGVQDTTLVPLDQLMFTADAKRHAAEAFLQTV